MEKVGKRFVWSDDEVQILKDNYGKIPLDEIGEKLGISHTTVRIKAIEIGLRKKRITRFCKWTKEQVDYLKKHYPDDSTSDVAFHIGFSPDTIVRKAQMLGLRKSKDYDTRRFYRRYVKDYKNTSM